MPENVMPGPVCDLGNVREAVCIHTRKIFDSCRDKDCVDNICHLYFREIQLFKIYFKEIL